MYKNGERVMAWIASIDEVQQIKDADQIVAYRVGGWWVVDKKDAYSVGDLAVYCAIDSWIPTELAPFLSKGQEPREYNGVKGERLRTVKLRGQLSQGLLLPFTAQFASSNLGACADAKFSDYENMDVSKQLNIQKWEAPIPAQLSGQVRGMFPSAIPKTDQERIQNLTAEIQHWKETNTLWEVTEKLDGSSCTFYLDADDELHVCSRNLDLNYDTKNTFWQMADKYHIREKMMAANLRNFAIQGEVIGEGIQKNRYNIKGQDFYVFDMYDAELMQYTRPLQRHAIAKGLGLNHVPVIVDDKDLGTGEVNYILTWADGKSRLNGKADREGLVFKQMDGECSFKAISNKFLLKGGE